MIDNEWTKELDDLKERIRELVRENEELKQKNRDLTREIFILEAERDWDSEG